ncbi:MAG: hypothetical protein ACXW28_09205 [Thermoanaerobaculia bacterium]
MSFAALVNGEDVVRPGAARLLHPGPQTRALLARFEGTARPFGTIGYKEAAAVVRGEMTERDAIEETKRRTRAYAKRQLTWLRSERNVQWVDAGDEALAAALRIIEGKT